MELPELVPIEYRGQLVALVSSRRVHIIAPWLATRPAGDPELRFVAFMALCCNEVLQGRLPGPYTNELGERWAHRALVLAGSPAAESALPRSNARRSMRDNTENHHPVGNEEDS